ncbi:hypothetical protein BHM03_00026779, partial [Ensete ventricosum]
MPSPLVTHACALSPPTGRLHAVTARRPCLRPLFSRARRRSVSRRREKDRG